MWVLTLFDTVIYKSGQKGIRELRVIAATWNDPESLSSSAWCQVGSHFIWQTGPTGHRASVSFYSIFCPQASGSWGLKSDWLFALSQQENKGCFLFVCFFFNSFLEENVVTGLNKKKSTEPLLKIITVLSSWWWVNENLTCLTRKEEQSVDGHLSCQSNGLFLWT